MSRLAPLPVENEQHPQLLLPVVTRSEMLDASKEKKKTQVEKKGTNERTYRWRISLFRADADEVITVHTTGTYAKACATRNEHLRTERYYKAWIGY